MINKAREKFEDVLVETNIDWIDSIFTIRAVISLFMLVLILAASPFLFGWSVILDIVYYSNLLFKFISKLIFKRIYIRVKLKRIEKILYNHQNKLLSSDNSYCLKSYSYREEFVNTCDNLKEFITNFIQIHNYNFNTYSSDGVIICGTNRRRSLGDIYLICKHYYPQCTIIDVLKILISLLNSKKIFGSYCNTINKYVYHVDSSAFNKTDPVEYSQEIRFNDLLDVYN